MLSVAGLPADSIAIEGLILQLYGNLNNGDGPLNSAQTRFRQIARLYTNCTQTPPASPCDQAAAQSNDYDLITDILQRYKAGGLNVLPAPGTGPAVTQLVNLLLRYTGLNANVCTFGTGIDCDATVYQPGSPATILTSPSGLAGVSLPEGTGTVDRPTIISVSRIEDPNFRLMSGLDQYPFRYLYTSSSGQGIDVADPFLREVTVEICLDANQNFPLGALDRLVIAHSIAEPEPYENIQILPSGATFLSGCDQQASADLPARSLLASAWHSVSSSIGAMLAPAPLSAVALATTTGTVGRTKTLSPFGAVDPIALISATSATSSAGPEGGTVPAPSVRVATPGNLAMANIPVTFAVTAGGGCFANPCTASSPTTLTINTDASGNASVPAWTVGLGVNTVTASGVIPCDAPVAAGTVANCGSIVIADGSSLLTFSATGMPPTQVGFNPATLTILTNLQTNGYAPGTPFNVTVLVQDGEDPPQTVPGSNAPIALTAVGGTLVCPAGCTRTAANGVVTFTGVYVTSIGSFTLTATSTGLTPAAPAPGGGINSVAPPSSAANIAINAGNNQTALEGTVLGAAVGTTAPSVRVTDIYGNVVGSAGVTFRVNGAGSASPQTQNTGPLGIASTNWTIVAGTNYLDAYITSLGTAGAVTFTATGISANTQVLACAASPGAGYDLSTQGFMVDVGRIKGVKQFTLYLASNDPANIPTVYGIDLTVGWRAKVDGPTTVLGTISNLPVTLRGSSSENRATQFVLPNAVGVPGSAKFLTFQWRVASNPNGANLYFAKGPSTCGNAVVYNSTLTTATKSKGVGITILGY